MGIVNKFRNIVESSAIDIYTGSVSLNPQHMKWIFEQLRTTEKLIAEKDDLHMAHDSLQRERVQLMNYNQLYKKLNTKDKHALIKSNIKHINKIKELETLLNNIAENKDIFEESLTIKSEHGEISAEVSSHNGMWVSIDGIKLVLAEFDENRKRYVIRAWNQNMLHDDYEYIQVINNKDELLNNQKNKLIKYKEKELNIITIETKTDMKKNMHVLAKRKSDNSYVVWTSPYTGELQTSYINYYNGSYDMDLNNAVKELNRRLKD